MAEEIKNVQPVSVEASAPAPENPEKRGMGLAKKRKITNTIIYVILGLISVIWLLPFFFLVLQSFRVDTTTLTTDIWPKQWGFDNYVYLFTPDLDNSFLKWYSNTFIMALFVAVIQTLMTLMMSYALSRFRFKLRKFLMNFMLILGMFPGFLTMIVLFQVLQLQIGDVKIHLIEENAVTGLIIVYVASSGMGYYVSKGFLDTISKSLDEAALIDGANRFQVFYKVILPLCKPIIIYTILTAFMGPWGDYVFAAFIANSNQAGMNVAVGLSQWTGQYIGDHFTHFCAGGVIVAIPVMVLFMFLQKYYVEGVTGGAVKG